MYLARPIRNDAGCAACHSTPSAAPRSLIARYGSDNGFGWQAGEVVGAQIVSVPFDNAVANADRAFQAYMISLAAIFAAVFLVVNAALYSMVVRPMRQIARVADRLSLGDISAEDFSQRGAKEIGALIRSFDRMRKSLEKALHLLEK
jgi:HAMP domain-containing protein